MSGTVQDIIVQKNVVKAQAIYREITGREYAMAIVEETAKQIFQDTLLIMRHVVRGSSFLTESPAPIMIELHKVSPLPQIQESLTTLVPILKAHRNIVEITWVYNIDKGKRPLYIEMRGDLLAMALKIKKNLPPATFSERRRLISPSKAYYEASCLTQAAKCLAPTDSMWISFSESIGKTLGDGAARTSKGTLVKLRNFVQESFIAPWYCELWALTWEATNITTYEEFAAKIVPKIEGFIEKGGKYTLGLINILLIIFENGDTTEELKNQVVPVLCNLVPITPTYDVSKFKIYTQDFFDKLLKKPDRYARTRSFSAAILSDIVLRPENEKYRPKIIEAVRTWKRNLEKDIVEKKEAEMRFAQLQEQIAAAQENQTQLIGQFLEIYENGEGPFEDINLDEPGTRAVVGRIYPNKVVFEKSDELRASREEGSASDPKARAELLIHLTKAIEENQEKIPILQSQWSEMGRVLEFSNAMIKERQGESEIVEELLKLLTSTEI